MLDSVNIDTKISEKKFPLNNEIVFDDGTNVDAENDQLEISITEFSDIANIFKPVAKEIKHLIPGIKTVEECEILSWCKIRYEYLLTLAIIENDQVVRSTEWMRYTTEPSTRFNPLISEALNVDDSPKEFISMTSTEFYVKDRFPVRSLTQQYSQKEEPVKKVLVSPDIVQLNTKKNSQALTFEDSVFTKQIGENFCEGFFIAGVTPSSQNILENSSSFTAQCGHQECSALPAIKPDIFYRLPPKDNKKFEINNCTANLCFPSGIKLCYSSDESTIKANQGFITVMTNLNGDRLYVMSYHFYLKIDFAYFQKLYKIDPIREFISQNIILFQESQLTAIDSTEMNAQLKTNIEFSNKLMTSENIYIPYCISLLSSVPNSFALESSIQIIFRLLSDYYSTKDNITPGNENMMLLLEDLLMHLVYELPIPPPNKLLNFFLPFRTSPIPLKGLVYQNLPTSNYSILILLDLFSPEIIIMILHLMLVEQKILFVGDNYDIIYKTADAFLSILFPLRWVNTYVPVLPVDMMKYLQSFMPFIMGIETQIFEKTRKIIENDVFLVNIHKNSMKIFSTNNKTKTDMKTLEKSVGKFPTYVSYFLKKEILSLQKVYNKSMNLSIQKLEEYDLKLRNIFLHGMVYLLGDYKKYTTYVNNQPVFNSLIFKKNKPDPFDKFYNDLSQSQNFTQFLQISNHDEFKYFNELCSINKDMFDHLRIHYLEKNFSETLQQRYARSGQLNEDQTQGKNGLTGTSCESHFHSHSKEAKNRRTSCKLHDDSKSPEDKAIYVLHPFYLEDNFSEVENLEQYIKLMTVPNEKEDMMIIDFVLFETKLHKLLSSPKSYLRKYSIPKSISKETSASQEKAPSKFVKIKSCRTLHILEQQLSIRKEKSQRFLETGMEANKPHARAPYKKRQSLLATICYTKNQKELAIYQEQIVEVIRDYMMSLLQSQQNSEMTVNEVSNLLHCKFARKEFAIILYQDKFKQDEKHELNEQSFQDLSKIVFYALLNCQNNPTQFEEIRLITKSTFCYYKVVNDKFYYIYTDICKNHISFDVWKEIEFWKYWVEFDLEEQSQNLTSHFSSEEEFYSTVLLSVAKSMLELKINPFYVSYCIQEKIAKIYLKDKNAVDDFHAGFGALEKDFK